jgi:glucan biosynthesis protein C
LSDSKPESAVTTLISKTLQPRLFFVDNLRVFLIALVLLVHLAITYGSPVGSWYYQEGILGMPTAAVYVAFLGLCQAFFMGLLFLLSGYFTAPAYDKKGGHQFLKDRLIRLGIPMVVFLGLVEPAVDYVVTQVNGTFHGSFLSYYSKYIFFGYGIMWFILALLLFAFAYAGWRRIQPKPTKSRPLPKNAVIFAFALLLGAVSFAIRQVFPMNYFSPLFSFQYAFFTQYIALFIVGLIAFRSNWLMTIPKETGKLWSKIALALLAFYLVIFIPTMLTGGLTSILGGFHWQAAAYAFWEQLFGIAVMISLTVWFREKLNFQNGLMKALSDSSFTAYIIQVPVLVLLALSFQSIQLPLLAKFAIACPIGVSLCFLCAYLVRKIPKADRVL